MNVILIDDDAVSIDILAAFIKPHLEHIDEVICAYDGNEAFDIILSTKPDIIVTDIEMPHVSGIDLLKKIQTIDKYAPHVIIISGYSNFEYARDALKLHVADYLLKPVDQDELIEKINGFTVQQDIENEGESENIFELVQSYISSHLHDTLRLYAIAEHFHYNAAYLGRIIKKETGTSFNEYVLKLRMIKAQSLLTITNQSIKEISIDVGFKDPEHFSKRFKKVVGVTPTDYRKQDK